MSAISRFRPAAGFNRKVQAFVAIAGSVALVAYWRSWGDCWHVMYDVPAALAMSAYVGQIVAEGALPQRRNSWLVRVLLLIPMTVLAGGREFLGWRVSGHLADLLSVAAIQTVDNRLSVAEKAAYWFPLPVICWIRWLAFDVDGHWETYSAVIASVAITISYVACLALMRSRQRT